MLTFTRSLTETVPGMLTVCSCAEDNYLLLMSSVGALLDDVHGDIAGSWKLEVPVRLWC